MAASNRIAPRRVGSVLEELGLAGVAHRPVGGFSLGMKQRLGIAAALHGDPEVLIFDEPVNGLAPAGVRWIRRLFRALAAEGRTLLVSSHLISEMDRTADRLVVIGRGRLLADTTVPGLLARFGGDVLVRSPRAAELQAALRAAGAAVVGEPEGALAVRGLDVGAIGDLAVARGIPVQEVLPRQASLEDAYMGLTADSTPYRARPEGDAVR